MRDIFIPQILYAGRQQNRLRLWLILAFLLALLLHLGLLAGLYFLGMHPLFLLLPQQQETPPDSMQYVLVDEKLMQEEADPQETTKLEGRVTRRSRATEIDPSLPKAGPQTTKKERSTDFAAGKPLPSQAPVTPSNPAQPVQQTTPQQPVQPRPPVAAQPPVTPPQPVEKPLVQEKPEPLEKTADLAPELTEDTVPEAVLLALKTEGIEGKSREKPQSKPDAPENKKKAQETQKQPQTEAKKQHVKATQPPRPEQPPAVAQPQQEPQPALPPAPQTMNIPVRRIGATQRTQGGVTGMRTNSSAAMKAGSQSMAVLRAKYGAYMDLILQRIQQSILIQQQLSPMMFNQGIVVMSFSVDAGGKLGGIRFIQAQPVDLTGESAAARRVLEDVASGEAFPPPSPQMLADPSFQKITINFLFEPR